MDSARDLGRPGWERRFGFGMLDLPAALTDEAPARDPLEPNDAVRWVDGTHFQPDRPVSRGRGLVHLRARLDSLDDPADVYRMLVPARRSLRISVAPSFGDPDLRVYGRRGGRASSRGRLIAGSRRGPGKVDRVAFTNSPTSADWRTSSSIRTPRTRSTRSTGCRCGGSVSTEPREHWRGEAAEDLPRGRRRRRAPAPVRARDLRG